MAQNKVMLEIMTPKKVFYSGEVEMVIVEETFGKEGFLAGHSPALKLLKEGKIEIKEEGAKEKRVALIPGGYISAGEKIVIFAAEACWQ